MRGIVAPSAVPIMVHAAKQFVKVLQMTFPREKQLKEQRQKVKNELDIRFLKGEEHMHFDGDVYEDQMKISRKPQHLQQQQQYAQEGLQISRLQMERMETQPSFLMFRPP